MPGKGYVPIPPYKATTINSYGGMVMLAMVDSNGMVVRSGQTADEMVEKCKDLGPFKITLSD